MSLSFRQEIERLRALLCVDLKPLAGDPRPRQVYHGILPATPSKSFTDYPVPHESVPPFRF